MSTPIVLKKQRPIKLPLIIRLLIVGLMNTDKAMHAPTMSCMVFVVNSTSSTCTRKGIRQARALIVGSFNA